MSGSYDRIARFYDVDMARNMPFDDVGFYGGICLRQGGRALELGCGNGRILLDLLARGVDAVGVDCVGGDARRARAQGRGARTAGARVPDGHSRAGAAHPASRRSSARIR